MTTLLTIKNGTITLPESMRKVLRNAQMRLSEHDGHVIIEGPVETERTNAQAALLAIAGIWKKRKISDPVHWQQKIRTEWDRKIG